MAWKSSMFAITAAIYKLVPHGAIVFLVGLRVQQLGSHSNACRWPFLPLWLFNNMTPFRAPIEGVRVFVSQGISSVNTLKWFGNQRGSFGIKCHLDAIEILFWNILQLILVKFILKKKFNFILLKIIKLELRMWKYKYIYLYTYISLKILSCYMFSIILKCGSWITRLRMTSHWISLVFR